MTLITTSSLIDVLKLYSSKITGNFIAEEIRKKCRASADKIANKIIKEYDVDSAIISDTKKFGNKVVLVIQVNLKKK